MQQVEVYSIAQAQEILGIGRTKIYQLLNKGTLKAVKCGRRTLIPSKEIAFFLESLEPYSSDIGGLND